jgi:hypothetical protein
MKKSSFNKNNPMTEAYLQDAKSIAHKESAYTISQHKFSKQLKARKMALREKSTEFNVAIKNTNSMFLQAQKLPQ